MPISIVYLPALLRVEIYTQHAPRKIAHTDPFRAYGADGGLQQKAVGSIERDENYVPHLRSHYKLPPQERARTADYAEVFEETPLMTLCRLVIMQSWCVLAFCNC